MKVEHYYPPNNHLLTEPKYGRAKRIKIWINGDTYCNEFSINPKNFRSWISILNHFTIMMKPGFGAIRKLVALSSMKIVDCFEDLDPYDKYVALGASCRLKFPPAGYNSNSERELLNQQKVKKKLYKGEINYQKSPFLIESEKKKLTIIYITVNGRHCQVPQKAIFKENELNNWNIIMIYLSKILDIPEGVESICTIFGDVLEKPIQFQHGFLYVAIPFKESFTDMDYLSLFKKENNFRKNYILSIKPSNGTSSNRGSPRIKKSTLPTYRIEKGRTNQDPAYCPCSPKFSSEKEHSLTSESQFQTRSKAAYDKHLQRCAIVRRRVNSARMKKEVADSIKAYDQRIDKIEKEKLKKSKTYSEMAKHQHIKKPRGQTVVAIINNPPCPTRTKRNSREAKPDSGYNSEDRKSMIESVKSGSGDCTVRRKTFLPAAKSEAALVRKISSDETTLGSSSSTITLKSGSKSGHSKPHKDTSGVPTSSIKDSGIPTLTKSSHSTTVTTDSENFSKNEKEFLASPLFAEFSNDLNIERNKSGGAISVIKEVSEGPSSLSEIETKEILSPKGRQMFSTSSDSIKYTSSEEKSCEKIMTAPERNIQKANSSTDRLRALFRSYSNKEENSEQTEQEEQEKRNCDCKSSYTDSLLEQTDSGSDLLKDSMENINQTTFGKIAGSKSSERKHVTINYSKPQGNRTTSCPTIMISQRALVPLVSSPSETSSLDVNSGTHVSCKSEESLKSNDDRNNQIVVRGDVHAKSVDSFSVEKYIIKSEDITVCEISSKEATSTTVIVVKEIERAEYSKMISSTKIIEVSDSLEVLPESDVQSDTSSCLVNEKV